MKSLSEFREMKKAISDRLLSERQDGKPRIIIGMGTCGIAAGAREILPRCTEPGGEPKT